MEWFTIELASNASEQIFLTIHPVLLQIVPPEQVNLEGQWEVAISEISHPSMHQNLIEGKFMFFD